eukprot:10076420-Ditylum_brightwellii.AAC.1
MEKCIISEVSKRFRLTENWSPFRSGPPASELGLLTENQAAVDIVEGKFTTTIRMGEHTRE